MQPFDKSYTFPSSGYGLDEVIARLVLQFEAIPWIEEVYGRAFKHKKDEWVIPRCLSRKGQYITLTPNTFKKAFCFFLPSGESDIQFDRTQNSGRSLLFERDLSLVVWFDAQKLNYGNQLPYDRLQHDCVKALVNCSDVMSINRAAEDEISLVFSDFTLMDDYYQFISWPYGAFKIDFRVGYRTAC